MGNARVVRISNKKSLCGECELSHHCVWEGLDQVEISELGLEVTTRLLRRGDHLFRAGDPFQALYVVRSGAVKTYMDSEDGEEQIIGFHLAGSIIGFNGIAEGTHVCNAATLDTSSVCVMPFERLSDLCTRSPHVQHELMRWMSRTIRRDETMLLTLGKKNAEQRLAAFLMSQSDHQRWRGYSATEFQLSMSRTDISNYLGLAVETVSRILTRFQSAGLLAIQRNQVRVLDLEALRGFAQSPGEVRGAQRRAGAVH